MSQKPRLSQLKQTSNEFTDFAEQYQDLEQKVTTLLLDIQTIQDLQNQIQNLQQQLEEVQTLMAITQAEYQALQNQVTTNTTDLSNLTATVDAINTALQALQTQVTDMSNRISTLETNQLTIAMDSIDFSHLDADGGEDGIQVTSDITLPTNTTNGTTISWVSDDPAHLDENGVVNRPTYAEGDANVTLTGTFTLGNESQNKDYLFNVPFDPTTMTDQNRADEDANALNLDFADENNGAAGVQVTQDISLPSTGSLYGSTITWQSSDETYITNDGVVTQPSSAIGDQNITLTATVTNGAATAIKPIVVTVLATT